MDNANRKQDQADDQRRRKAGLIDAVLMLLAIIGGIRFAVVAAQHDMPFLDVTAIGLGIASSWMWLFHAITRAIRTVRATPKTEPER